MARCGLGRLVLCFSLFFLYEFLYIRLVFFFRVYFCNGAPINTRSATLSAVCCLEILCECGEEHWHELVFAT
ncbi:uncharacterized protein F4817DRAFT_72437 [Daldinia loculata]|uniref:uncharacterized protein n=1 Tax=Daldinia loculata TaxID=103429 RepID=UPI0020C3C013|nr:uncharacterized protein F4817DRAFT_72437 [Daldinia loculata]KAI1648385.1 hypothetical protein F4817DRAFT_72437 [Daldinia loculata]